MTQRSVTHATFAVERTYDAPPPTVFAAWSDQEAKAEWFAGPAAKSNGDYELDFRVGGREVNRGGPEGGPVFTYDARFHDIVQDERIVYAYDMYMGDTRISVSIGTVELAPAGDGTRLLYTETGAFLDGHDRPEQRQDGTGRLLDALGAVLAGHRARA
jgi:uncharacterized protein YndB with AHSA1/START domain